MIGIKEIASYIPERVRDNIQLAAKFGKSSDFIRERIGGIYLPIKEPEMNTSDMACRAIENLLNKSGVGKNEIGCLVLCTQNPDGRGLPHTAAIVQEKLELPRALAAFDISLGCSGYVYGINIIKGFMDSADLKIGVLVTADPYSKIIDSKDPTTVMLFGDAASATLLVREDSILEIKKSLYGTDGRGSIHLINDGGRLHMNGRQVFNFAAITVPHLVENLLDEEKMEISDIDQFVFHQGSRYIVETLIRRLKLDKKKVPLRIEKTGNTVSSSIPLILENSIQEPRVRNILIAGFGVGWSWGGMILTRKQK